MHSLRVVVVAPPYYEVPPAGYGGVERVCALLVDGLARRGHDVTLVAAGAHHTAGRFVQTLPVAPGEGTDDDVGVEVLHMARALAAIHALRPDIVHHHSRVGLLATSTRARSVATVHYAVSGPESQGEFYRALEDRVPLVAISDAQRDAAQDLAWIGRVHNGIDPEAHPLREAKDDFVLYLGRLSSAKGLDLAIAAAGAAGRRLVVAGAPTTAPEQRWVETELADVAIADVEFIGEVSGAERIELLGRAACLLHLSRWEEPFGLAVVEAMACGTPVVVTRHGALAELIRDGETGVLCDEIDDYAAAIERAVALRPDRCRGWVIDRFTADRMVDEYVEVYRRLLD